MATFDPSAVTSSPYFVTYNWTTAGVWYSPDGTPGTFEPVGGYAIGWSENQPTTTFSAQFFTPGQYLLEVQCVASVYSVYNGSLIASFTQTGYIGGDASDIDMSGGGGTANVRKAHGMVAHLASGGAGITVVPATVTFFDTSIKLGLGAPTAHQKLLTATVTPGYEINSISFKALNNLGGASNEVTILTDAENLATGKVTLLVTAASPTPASTGGSPDCTVSATTSSYVGTTTLASASVIVYIPTRVGTPHDPAVPTLYTAAPKKLFETAKTVPTLIVVDEHNNPINIPEGDGYCVWDYGPLTTITVWDQFNHPLDPIYNGAPVFEGSTYINETISNGTYQDSVGITQDACLGDGGDPGRGIDGSYLKPTDKIVAQFFAGKFAPIPLDTVLESDPLDGDPPVSINHILLNPGIVGRIIWSSPPDMIGISWPTQ